MPTVYIWYPDKDNKYGHASLQTDKYHISFWPDGDLKELLGSKPIHSGVPGCLVFHQELDRSNEGNRLPTGIYKISKVSDEAINLVYEEFLHYNGIDPKEVTLEVGEKLVEKSTSPEVTVPLTKYAVVPEQFEKPKFYEQKHNCVSMCWSMILKGNKTSKWHELLLAVVASSTFENLDAFTVPWFESHIKKFWAEGNGWNSLNVFDNAIIRSTRYWTWDRWTSKSQTGQKIGFRNLPIDFKALAGKTNKK